MNILRILIRRIRINISYIKLKFFKYKFISYQETVSLMDEFSVYLNLFLNHFSWE
jgi:hypothetical protein